MGTLLNTRKSIKWVPKEVTRREVWFLWGDFSCSRISTYFISIHRTEAVNAVYVIAPCKRIRNPESSKFCSWNPESRHKNPESTMVWNPKSTLLWNPESSRLESGIQRVEIQNPDAGIRNPGPSWILLHRANVMSLVSFNGLLRSNTEHVENLMMSSKCGIVLYLLQSTTLLRYGAYSPRISSLCGGVWYLLQRATAIRRM